MSTTEHTHQAEDLAVDPFRVRHPPAGLSKDERRDWAADEGTRIADLLDQARSTRRAVVGGTKIPKGLGLRGRRAFNDADSRNRARRLSEANTQDQADRHTGAIVLAVLLVAGALAWFVVSEQRADDGQDGARAIAGWTQQRPAPTPTVTYAPVDHTLDPAAAAGDWFERTCGNSAADPAPARLARHKDLMTPSAYAAIPKEIPLGDWECSHVSTLAFPAYATDGITAIPGTSVATISATIHPADGKAQPVTVRRYVIEQPDGHWLVGDLVPAN